MDPLEQHLPYALRQFENEILIPLEILGLNASFTTSSSAKLTTALLLVLYLVFAVRERRLVPNRLQAGAELIYSFVADTVTKGCRTRSKSFDPVHFQPSSCLCCSARSSASPRSRKPSQRTSW